MKRIIELSENDYKALKEDGVQNHIALADTIIAHSVPYEDRPQAEWMNLDDTYYMCPFCHKVEYIISDYCRKCGAKLRKWEEE